MARITKRRSARCASRRVFPLERRRPMYTLAAGRWCAWVSREIWPQELRWVLGARKDGKRRIEYCSPHSRANPVTGLSLPGVAAAIPKGFNPVITPEVLAESVGFSQEVTQLENMTPTHQAEALVSRVYAAAVTPEPGATPAAATILEPLATPPAAIPEPPPIFTIL